MQKDDAINMMLGMFGLVIDECKKSADEWLGAVKREATITQKKALRAYKTNKLGESVVKTGEIDQKLLESIKKLDQEILELETA